MVKSSEHVGAASKKKAAPKPSKKEASIVKAFAFVDKHRGAFGSIAEGARITNINYHTFRDRYTSRYSGKTFYGPRPVLGRNTEQALHDHVVSCSQVAMCLTVTLICLLAQATSARLFPTAARAAPARTLRTSPGSARRPGRGPCR